MAESATACDYRALLHKYIAHVVEREGVSCLVECDDAGEPRVPPRFTADEWAELQRLDRDLRTAQTPSPRSTPR